MSTSIFEDILNNLFSRCETANNEYLWDIFYDVIKSTQLMLSFCYHVFCLLRVFLHLLFVLLQI